jgi:hypothetical protein
MSKNIGLEEMAEALSRWGDFVDVTAPADLEQRVEETRRRMDSGEKLPDILAEQIESGSPELVGAIRAIARSVGLDQDAYAAFILGIGPVIGDQSDFPIESAIDTAAFAGLIVGLTARQLADDSD